MRTPHYALLAAVLLGGCFADTGDDGPGGSGTATGGDTGDDGGDGASGKTSGMSGASGPSTTDTSADNTGPETGTSSESGEPDCTPGECPPEQFCVEGACQTDPPPDMIAVPAGIFYRGCNDTDCGADESPPDPALHLSTFAIDRLEVTTGAYALCIDDGACTAAATTYAECNGPRLPSYADHPINCVDFAQADAYCAFVGRRLPTEAEWEKAARGADGRRHPWGGSNATCTLMVKVDNGFGCGTGETWPVGSKPAGISPFGLLNVAGNVREWVADWYGTYQAGVPDPQGPATGTERVTRGLSLINGANTSIRISNRTPADPALVSFALGFRCATSG